MSHADGSAERTAAGAMIELHANRAGKITNGAVRAFDTQDFVSLGHVTTFGAPESMTNEQQQPIIFWRHIAPLDDGL